MTVTLPTPGLLQDYMTHARPKYCEEVYHWTMSPRTTYFETDEGTTQRSNTHYYIVDSRKELQNNEMENNGSQ